MAEFNRFIEAGETVKRVLKSLGLPVPTSVSGATDATSRQMWALLTECGQELLSKYEWSMQIRTHTIVTDTGTTYALPTDFEYYVDETGWNNTGRTPLIGPLNLQQWRMLQARQLGGTTLRLQYIISEGNLELYFAPTPAQTLELNYIGRGWVQDADNTAIYRDFAEADTDIVLFAPRLMITMLKLKWREAKGFDTVAAAAEFNTALNDAKYNDAPKKSLALGSRQKFPYLGFANMTDTGYGS